MVIDLVAKPMIVNFFCARKVAPAFKPDIVALLVGSATRLTAPPEVSTEVTQLGCPLWPPQTPPQPLAP